MNERDAGRWGDVLRSAARDYLACAHLGATMMAAYAALDPGDA